jgi:hypothetical protein
MMLLDGVEVANGAVSITTPATGTLKYEGELAAGSHTLELYG